MTEVTYEGMFLLDSNKYATNAEGTLQVVLGILERVGGKLLASRPWQDTKLSYPINGHRKGLYFLTYFTLDTQKIGELQRLVKLAEETILRHMLVKLDPALIEPMVNMALGRGEIVSSFHDTDSPTDASGIPVPAVAAIEAT